MIINIILFKGIFAFLTIMSCILTVTAINSIFSILGLIFTFVFAASFLLITGIEFIAISYIIIYVGAIAILFLFVILMINIESDNSNNKNLLYESFPLGVTIFSLIAYTFLNLFPLLVKNLFFLFQVGSSFSLLTPLSVVPQGSAEFYPQHLDMFSISQIESLGLNLYTYHSVLIILLGFILLLAMVASIELSIEKNKQSKKNN